MIENVENFPPELNPFAAAIVHRPVLHQAEIDILRAGPIQDIEA
jgi:hypothetical protein